MAEKCKTNDWDCIYHACMSDNCQKRFMKYQVKEFGPGKCEEKKDDSYPLIPVAKPGDCIIKEISNAPPWDGKIKLL